MEFPGNEALIERQTVGEDSGNAWSAWREMGRPRQPNRDQMRILQQASIPRMEIRRMAVEHGVLSLSLSLSRNEVTLVEISRRTDEAPSYAGLPDDRATRIIIEP
jgi:xylan 1,4-beta-xylosidase